MFRRNLVSSIDEALADTRVVLLNGPRQSGKSTLAQVFGRRDGARFVSLDDPAVFAQAAADPYAFVGRSGARLLVIDEAQRVPELFQAIKLEVDRDPTPGRFLLTGSANYLMLPRVSDSLAGRIEINTLWPLSQGELTGMVEGFIDALFSSAEDSLALPPSTLGREGALSLALTGGYPEVIARPNPARASAWFDAYVATLLQRDIRDVANVEAISAFPGLLGLLASRSGSLVNAADVARSLTLSYTTLRRYQDLLVTLFLVEPLHAWSTNPGARFVRTAKMPICDSGLMAHLLGEGRTRIVGDPQLAGSLLETFVIAELRKQLTWTARRPAMFYARNYAGREVDVVLQRAAGREVVGIEVKASISISQRDFAGLKWLSDECGDRFVRGVLLYTGEQSLQFGDRLWALPVDSLWRLGARPQATAEA